MLLKKLKSFVSYLLYITAVTIVMPLLPLKLWWRGHKAPAYRLRMGERFSLAPLRLRAGGIWVHAVSVGEVVAITPTINDLLKVYPERGVLVTTTTPTGSQRLLNSFSKKNPTGNDAPSGQIYHQYLPYDWPPLIWLFLRSTRPSLLIVVETELWPVTLLLCRWLSIPVIIANARLSAKSAKGYRKISWLAQSMLKDAWIAAQAASDSSHFIGIGAAENKIRVLGNIKYDAVIDDRDRVQALNLRSAIKKAGKDFVWVAGSTHRGEDEIILTAHQWLLEQAPDALLILVPRHPERFDEVAMLLERAGLSYSRRSEVDSITRHNHVLLLDQMGELMMSYGASDFAFVGGSLVAVGGHNYLEPAMWSLPMATGPSQHNFQSIASELKSKNALSEANSVDELVEVLLKMQGDSALRKSLGENALMVVDNNRGAQQKLLQFIGTLLTQ